MENKHILYVGGRPDYEWRKNMLKVEKRNGIIVDFEREKIGEAVKKAMAETETGKIGRAHV